MFGRIATWMETWLQPSGDRRQAPRINTSGVRAYYWDGAAPLPQELLNISETGAYISGCTQPYRGTILDLTIQPASGVEADAARALRVTSKVVRTDQGGFAVQFLFPEAARREEVHSLLEELSARVLPAVAEKS